MRAGSVASKKNKEELILKAALKVIKQKGLHRARMADMAKEAGISYGLIYHYFGNKEDLFDAILDRWWTGLFRLMEAIGVSGYDVPRKLRCIVDYFLDTYQAHPELVNIFITEISRSATNLTTRRLENFKRFMLLTEGVIAEGQGKRILRKDFKARYLTYIFLGSLETFVSAMVLVDQRIKNDGQKERIAKSILDVFLKGASRLKTRDRKKMDKR